ncbi:LysR family transcriptional regulator, partial [bacterium]|nr:LysR family transcriptional regulator [bacterium]MBU1918926.1 LysR family transcriptional regulator [bacterium]
AKKLFLTQPAITSQIKVLETYFGYPLLFRSGNKMELTIEGEKLYPEAKKIIASYENFLVSLKKESVKTKTINFSAIDSATQTIIPEAINHFLLKHPQAVLKPHVYATKDAIQQILQKTLDLAICTIDNIPSNIKQRKLFTEDLVLIGTDKHRDITHAQKLDKESFIIFPKSSQTREHINKAFHNLNISPTIILETIKVSSIISFIEAGMGVSIVPYYSVWREIKSKRIHIIPIKTKIKRTVGYIYIDAFAQALTNIDFMNFLNNSCKNMIKQFA